MMMEFSVVPLDKGPSISPYVARCVDLVERSGLEYRLTAMGTIIEGPLDQLLAVLKQCLEAVTDDCQRVTCSVKLDYRQASGSRLEAKVQSVESQLGRAVNK